MPRNENRQALAAQAAGTAVATREEQEGTSLAQTIRRVIEKQGNAFAQVMPSNVDSDRFARLVLTAVKATPKLMECFQTADGQTSVLLAAMKAAAVGLEPNTELQHAWLTPRSRKIKGDNGRDVWVTEAQLSIGYRGYLDLARRSGDIVDIYAEVVREGDEFEEVRGLHRDLIHKPKKHTSGQERGALTHAYAVAHFKSGGYAFMVLDELDVHARRAKSDSWSNERSRPYSPWTNQEPAMWKKSAIRALVPYLPLSADVQRDLAADEARLSLSDDRSAIDVAWEEDDRVAIAVQSVATAGGSDEAVVATAAVPDPAEPPPADPDAADPPQTDYRKPTQPQMRKLFKSLSDIDIDDDSRKQWATDQLKREITSFDQLTRNEAAFLIDVAEGTAALENSDPS